MEFFIKKVLDHWGNLKLKTDIEFLVKWLGYDERCDSWELYANLRDSELHAYSLQIDPDQIPLHLITTNLESFEDFFPLFAYSDGQEGFSEVFSQLKSDICRIGSVEFNNSTLEASSYIFDNQLSILAAHGTEGSFSQ